MIALKKGNKKKKRNRLPVFCVLLVVIAAVSVKLTLALTTVEPYTTNVATIGEVKIALINVYNGITIDTDGKQAALTANPPVFEPNTDVPKTVKVKNVGKFPCYVRLIVEKEWIYRSGMSQYIMSDCISWQVNSKWVLETGIDGDFSYDDYFCYYYTDILAPNEETDPLFKDNKFHIGNYDKTYGSQSNGHIYVQAQAVQSDNVPSDSFGDVGDLTSTKTFVRNSEGKIVKWNGLYFE